MNETLKFVHNERPEYEICRIYFDVEEDEAVWVIRRNENKVKHKIGEEEEKANDKMHIEDEMENKRRAIEEEMVLKKQAEKERADKVVDEQWLLSLFHSSDLGTININSSDSSKCFRNSFVQYFNNQRVPKEISERVFDYIDDKKRGFINSRQFFQWRTQFTVDHMRDLLPVIFAVYLLLFLMFFILYLKTGILSTRSHREIKGCSSKT